MDSKFTRLLKNLMIALFAQGVSLFLSVLISFILPKFLGVTEYSYWQLFVFYANYSCFLLFGLNFGLNLKYGGKEYNELKFYEIASQFWSGIFIQTIVLILLTIVTTHQDMGYQRKIILFILLIYAYTSNITGFFNSIFQATNRIKEYSFVVLIDKISLLILITAGLILKINSFIPYIIAYTFTSTISLIYCLKTGGSLIFTKIFISRNIIREYLSNIISGCSLLFVSLASNIIIGIGRVLIDQNWGIEAFGKVSFSISISNFFLLFMTQISVVLFPTLRTTNSEQLKTFYLMLRKSLSILLMGIFLLYVPIEALLGFWLPSYKESLKYLALLLPLCSFDGKTQLVSNTYLKVLRKEKQALLINAVTCVISFILSLISALILNSLLAVILSLVISVAVRSILGELYVSKLMNSNIRWEILTECMLVVVFMTSSWFLSTINALLVYGIAYMVYLFIYQQNVIEILTIAKKTLVHQK